MRGSLYALCALVVAGSCAAGCGAPAEAEANPVKAAEDALFDQLTCSDVARPSTLARVRAVFDHPSAETVGALATNPQDLATLVSVAGPEAEAGIVAVKNAVRVPDLFEHGWDGVQCKEPFTLDCTAGSETVDVQCAAGAANRIDLRFDKCTLGGSVLDGAVSLVKSGDDARAVFDALSVDETQVIEGAVTLKLASSSSTFEASLTTDDGLSLVDHGGPDGGLSCGEVLRIDALGVSGDGRDVIVDLAGFHETVDEKIGVTTLDDGLRFDGACGCPLPGSGAVFDLPEPLGKPGVAHATVRYTAPPDDGACARASVTLGDWPASCTGLGDDCAKAATESTLSSLLSAFCVDLNRG